MTDAEKIAKQRNEIGRLSGFGRANILGNTVVISQKRLRRRANTEVGLLNTSEPTSSRN
jgi:hypothetical protein